MRPASRARARGSGGCRRRGSLASCRFSSPPPYPSLVPAEAGTQCRNQLTRPSSPWIPACAGMSGIGWTGTALADGCVVLFRLESNQYLTAAEIEHRALDHRRLRQHQRDGSLFGHTFFVFVGQLFECRAGFVEQGFPANLLRPTFELVAL